MRQITGAVRHALAKQNWYAALFVSLTLPDICVALEHGKSTGSGYATWFEKYLSQYSGFLSGNDCYALRCSLLHEGKDDITNQRKQEVLDHYVFMTQGSHCNLIRDCEFDGVKKSFLELNVQTFCADMCDAVEAWLGESAGNAVIQDRLKQTIEIHEPGYIYRGAIRFE